MRAVIGRFAPSPTGRLHLGSLTTAVASFCHIKSLGGKWLLRLEDTDFERCKAIYSDSILQDLDNLGLCWDDEVVYQSARLSIYEDCLHTLNKHVYACDCSRKQLAATAVITAKHNTIYPRFCLTKNKPFDNNKLRLALLDTFFVYQDGLQGVQNSNPQRELGDVVIKRQNGVFNYLYTAAIDDGLQNISHIMRGLDIMPMTAAQIFIRQAANLPAVDCHHHLPLLYNHQGQKLSKQNLAAPIDTSNPVPLLITALHLLGQRLPTDPLLCSKEELLHFAISHWHDKPLHAQQFDQRF
ncbi:MAG: tRNA glutamyl-Q(34) synthetase GluQRS [Moraxella sp.]|nr:tRNA glutamyl-Q(34) synthetase GluQRS [Moraxella sp.]